MTLPGSSNVLAFHSEKLAFACKTGKPIVKLNLRVPGDVLKTRQAAWKPVKKEIPHGYMRRYVRLVSSAAKGAVLE